MRRILARLDVVVERILAWDEEALERVSTSPVFRALDLPLLVATYVGYGYLWAALALALIVFGTPLDHKNVLVGVGITILVVLVCQGVKALTARPRPSFVRRGFHHQFLTTSSFPSNHTAMAFAMAYLVARFYPAWYNVLLLYLLAFLIGLSRVYLREHYPLDVLGGAALGTYLAHGLLPWLAQCVG
ncbi:MAG: phosphatase PAP2 family protein [Candidatus Bipolaricaulota bacterium]|nr:phosphatase PAP2 family protein [Candidatus Bipolaricaulota bacterium]MDW8126887.1 phosphatase PAP2 family protein [Candidatus Bipolaricaulota bacterium]